MYKIFAKHLNVGQTMNRWSVVANDFDELVGYTHLGDIFLCNSKTKQMAILFTISPELVPLAINSVLEFECSFLSNPEAKRTILQEEKLRKIEARLGGLGDEEIYIPVPFPFMGGDRSVESYKIGNVFTYLELVGGLQDVG
ncbi:hypothetical protein D3C71_1273830 [compost metagenome]